MWTREFFGMTIYQFVAPFIIYSMLGWLVESIYMSFCNKKITNRGFGAGPFCPIYGFGGVLGYMILSPLRQNVVALYIVGAILATAFEFLVGSMMIKFLGKLWWDYDEKPFNYKGVICLESTIAWGFYAIIIVNFLHGKIIGFIESFDMGMGIRLCQMILCLVLIDYIFQFYKLLGEQIREYREKIKEAYHMFKARWY